MKTIKIYCDMDGVLADFNAEKNAIERFKSERGFFKKLKPIEINVKALNDFIKNGFDVNILSTSPHEKADRDKIKWLKKYLPKIKKEKIIFGRPNIPKINYINDIDKKDSLLIDDYGVNIKEWLNGGGYHAVKITQKIKSVDDNEFKNIKMLYDYIGTL